MPEEDKIKQAFSKVKEDILDLKSEIQGLKQTLSIADNQTDTPTNQTDRHINQTVPHEVVGSKPQNSSISTGNEGVQTDRQTIRQTDRHIEKFALNRDLDPHLAKNLDPLAKIQKVSDALDSLDEIKRDLRSQFKKLTPQEMLIFSTVYQLENEKFPVDYSSVSNKTGLSESAVRDYVQKLIKKGVPIDKIKENNKKITLSIASQLKRMASLSTIISLREL